MRFLLQSHPIAKDLIIIMKSDPLELSTNNNLYVLVSKPPLGTSSPITKEAEQDQEPPSTETNESPKD